MARKPKLPPSPPSKAYLVSFGDTMTALLAFFIVMNSLSKEQTGANLYSGTGSFVSAVDAIGFAGTSPGDRSRHVSRKKAPMPLYALSENLEKNPDADGEVGPDDENDNERKMDRDKENFQRFLTEMEHQFGLDQKETIANQVVFDSFESLKKKNDSDVLSDHAIELAAEVMPLLRDRKKSVEVIVWATMPSPTIINKTLTKTQLIKKEIQSKFQLSLSSNDQIRYSVKPWLFSDAKRPVISFVVGQLDRSAF